MTRIFRVATAALVLSLVAAAADRGPVDGLNHFSDSLYRHAVKGGGNVVLSSYSIAAALSMALTGARGDTAAELREGLGADGEALAPLIEGILKSANTNGNQLTAANSLWVQQGFSILPEFTQQLDRLFHAAPAQVDFKENVEAARGAINAWTDRETRGKIKDLFARGAIKPNARLVLASAIYFNGKWEKPFRKTDTQPAPFTTANGATEQVPFMHRTGSFGYAETAAGQTLEIRYGGTGLVFDILLPKKGEKLAAAEADIAGWLGGLHDREVKAYVPRFQVAYETELAAALESMGMRKAFGAADFSGIDDKRDLHLAQVVHKAWIDVTEEGTEAAAATGAVMATVAMRMPDEPVFRADRPFVFLIRDRKSGLILFTGRLTNPKS
jgi:serpin B